MKKRNNKLTKDFGSAVRNIDDKFEPSELQNPVPWPFIAIAVALAIFGGFTLYLDAQATDDGGDEQLAKTAADKDTAPAKVTAADMDGADGDMMAAQGAALFATHCATCHQTNGSGVRGAIPPLDESRYVLAEATAPIAILLRGISGPIEVKGNTYNGRMPTFYATLDDQEIALILTHVRSSWSNAAEAVTAEQVAKTRQAFAGNLNQPWQGGFELQSVFGIASVSSDPIQAQTEVTAQHAEDQEVAQ